MKYYEQIKQNLLDAIQNTVDNRHLFVKNPKADFIRNKKLPFFDCLSFILTIGGNSINAELLKHCLSNNITLSAAAFIQQRRKIKLEAFKNIFNVFLSSIDSLKIFKGYRLIAADGCMIQIPYNPDEKETYMYNGENCKGWNKLHLNAFYDLLNKIYVSIDIEPGTKQSEAASAMLMAKEFKYKSIVIADRGYCTFNVLQTYQDTKQKFLIRSKAPESQGSVLSGMNLENTLSDDQFIKIHVKRSRAKNWGNDQGLYKRIFGKETFSNLKTGDEYIFNFRVIKVPLSTGEIEYLITNLSDEEFSYDELVELYNSRWGIETSFRDLKYSLSLLCFHSKKAEYAMQEVYAKIIMYNYSSLITQNTRIPNNSTEKKEYKINFKIAILICMYYFKCKDTLLNIEELLLKYIYKFRPNRVFNRNKHRRDPIFFNYRPL